MTEDSQKAQLVQNLSLYKEFQAEREEILKHNGLNPRKRVMILGSIRHWWIGWSITAKLGESLVKSSNKMHAPTCLRRSTVGHLTHSHAQ